MILKSLCIEGYGPFSSQTTLEVDEQLTVLTGRNDVGKTALLRLFQLICQSATIAQTDVNLDSFYNSGVSWGQFEGAKCTATYVLTSNYQDYIAADNVR